MPIESSISNYTFTFVKSYINEENEIMEGRYIFQQYTNSLKVLLSDYTLKGTKNVLEDIASKSDGKRLYVVGITYMDKETLQPIDTQIGITGKIKFGETHLEGAERELIEEFGSAFKSYEPVSVADNFKIKIFAFNCRDCIPINNISIITDKIKNLNKDDKSKKVGTIIIGELKDLINLIMNIKFKLYIEKDIYGIKLLSLDDILNIPPTKLRIN